MARKKTSNALVAMTAEDQRWRAKSDLDTLERAEEIKRDKERHRGALREANERQRSLSRIQQRGDGAEPRRAPGKRRGPDLKKRLENRRI